MNQAEDLSCSGAAGGAVAADSPNRIPMIDVEAAAQASHWELRTEEQHYAFLNDKDTAGQNCYGQEIDLVALTGLPAERPMYINENPDVGINPNRNKQHGFFFTADNCIGCHACEAACSEKNENPSHLAFRSVGYVEGGSYPDYQRLNISMACNHCDDPVCLKGCPTGAYTKHAEYGAVLQDPDTCFGCGYCTWVCPYNAPQLDPVQGQVSKCNMCVDRLEIGLKPACVSACVGNALDFGVIENVPENREQAKTSIPGFPDPDITHPNIRFQQTRSLHEEMARTDSAPVKYARDKQGNYQPAVDRKVGSAAHWNLGRLSSRENPLVIFTLALQAAMGAFVLAFMGDLMGFELFRNLRDGVAYVPLLLLCFSLGGIGSFLSATHLGKPLRFYRGFNNLRYSPMAREILGVAGFIATLGLHTLFSLPGNEIFQSLYQLAFGAQLTSLIVLASAKSIADTMGLFCVLWAVFAMYYMVRSYRIKARPFWNHYQVLTAFFGSFLALGALLVGAVAVTALLVAGKEYGQFLLTCGSLLAAGIAVEGLGLIMHHRDMSAAEHEGAASHYIQRTTFGKTYWLRNTLMGLHLIVITILLIGPWTHTGALLVLALVGLSQLLVSTVGRALFYVLVVPSTMPGAFFWKNKAFEEHARDIGLASMPQTGVLIKDH